jgi:glutamate racemase
VSSAEETAKDVYRVLVRSGTLRSGDGEGDAPQHRFVATGDPALFRKLGRRFLGPEIGVVESTPVGLVARDTG